jgi:hypothetical protein
LNTTGEKVIHDTNPELHTKIVPRTSMKKNPKFAVVIPHKPHQETPATMETPATNNILPKDFNNHIVLENYKKELKSKDSEIRSVREQWQDEVWELNQEKAKALKTEQELRALIKHRDMASRQAEGCGKDPLEEILFSQNHQIHSLTQRVQDMKKQMSFCQQSPQQSAEINKCAIDEAMSKISSEMESVMHGHDINKSLLCPSFLIGADLRDLVRAIFGNRRGPEDEMSHFRRFMAKFGLEPQIIIRSLISAALQIWVFRTDFPNFDRTRSRLLEAFRKVVLTHGKTSFVRC